MKSKLLTATFFIASFFVFSSTAFGQSMQGDTKIGLGLGYGQEIEEIGLGLNANYAVTDDIRIAGDFYYYFVADEEFSGQTVEFDVYELNANVHYLFINDESSILYGLAGLNYFNIGASSEADGVTVSADENEVGLNLGAGFEFLANEQISLFGEAKYAVSDFDQFLFSAGARFKL